MSPLPHPPLTPFGSALAGALGSVFANAVVYPLDTVKTRLQALDEDELELFDPEQTVSSSATDVEKAARAAENDDTTKARPTARSSATQLQLIKGLINRRLKHSGMLVLLLKILKTEGLAGAFHGFGASMLGTFSQQFAYFFFHTFLRTNYIRRLARSAPTKGKGNALPSLSTAAELLLGALAGALAQIFTIPVNVIATRQQLWRPNSDSGSDSDSDSALKNAGKAKGVHPHAPSLLETANEIISESGITGLWTGLKPGLVLTVNPAITYGVFERMKSWRLASGSAPPGGKLGVAEAFWIGVGSKTLATVVTYPYIFAKVRLQAKSDDSLPSPPSTILPSSSSPELKPESTSDASDTLHPASDSQTAPSYASIAALPPPSFGSATNNSPAPRPALKRHHSRHPHYKGAIDLLSAIYKEKGVGGWYQGLGAQVLKAVLCQGITFVSKDQFESYAYLLIVFFARLRKQAGVI